jgi:hypothetical protein
VRVDDLPHDREPDPRAGRRLAGAGCTVEPLEDALGLFGRDTDALVEDAHQHLVVPERRRLDPDGRGRRRELHRVRHQVLEDAGGRDPVCEDVEVVGNRGLEVAPVEDVPELLDGVVDERADGAALDPDLQLAALEPGEGEQVRDEVIEARSGDRDALDQLAPALVRQGVPVGEQRLREPLDRGQRRAQLVRDGRDEVGLQPVELAQGLRRLALALVRPGELLFGPLLLADVAHGGRDEHALVGLERAEADLDRELAPIPPKSVELELCTHRTDARRREVPRPVRGMTGTEPLRHQHLLGLADQLFGVVAEQILGARVHELDRTVGIDDHHRIRRGLEQPAEHRIRTPALGHVARDHRGADRRAGDVADGRPASETSIRVPSFRTRTVSKWAICSPLRIRSRISCTSGCSSLGTMVVTERPRISSAP